EPVAVRERNHCACALPGDHAGILRRTAPEHLGSACVVDPSIDLHRVEAQQVSPLDERDAPLVDEPADVADLDAEPVGYGVDVDELGRGGGCGHGCVLSWPSYALPTREARSC